LGAPARLIGKTGQDLHGEFIREGLKRENVELKYLFFDREHPTAQCYAVRDSQDEATYYNWPRPNAADMLNASDIGYDAVENAYAVHATGIAFSREPRRGAVLCALELARHQHTIVSFDASFPPARSAAAKGDARRAMHMADCVKVNLAELLFWTNTEKPIEKLTKMLIQSNFELNDLRNAFLRGLIDSFRSEHFPPILLLTLGRHGSYVIRDADSIYCPPLQVTTASSIGAGDGYVAGLLVELANRQVAREDLVSLDAGKWKYLGMVANACGALSTRRLTAFDSFPSMPEVRELLDQRPELCSDGTSI
jgi:fructokinase